MSPINAPKVSKSIPDLKPTQKTSKFIGSTGNTVYGGYYSEDHLTALQGQNAIAVYEKMRRSDAQIKMVLSAIKNPIKSASFSFDAEYEDEEMQRIAEFLSFNWFENPNFEFNDWLSEVLTFLDFGFSVHEKYFDVYDHPDFGLIHIIGGLGFRKQSTIEQFNIDGKKGLTGVRQLVFGDTANNSSQDVFLPKESLCIFTNEREGDNYEGISLLRSCYGAYFRKDLYLKLNGIGIEKASIGIPIGKYPKGTESSEDKDAFIDALASFAIHESSYLAVPEAYEVEVCKIDFDSEKIMSAIQYEDVQMSKSILFQFLELGTNSKSGSFSLGADLSDIALASIQYIGDMICRKVNGINEYLVGLNYGRVKDIPKMICSGINAKAGEELSKVMKNLTDAQIVIPDPRLEKHVRKLYNLPTIDETARKEERENAQPKPEPEPEPDDTEDDTGKPTGSQFAEGFKYFRDLTVYEKSIDLAEIRDDFDNEGDKLARMIKAQLAILNEKTIRVTEILLKRYQKDRIKAALEIDISPKTIYKALLTQLGNIVAVGSRQAKKELVKKSGSDFASVSQAFKRDIEFLPPHVKNALILQATEQADTYVKETKKVVAFSVSSGVESELSDKEILHNIEQSLDDYAESSKVTSGARTMAAQAINRGRDGFFFDQNNLKKIQAFQYSAVNDAQTTDICLSLDNKIVKPNDPDLPRLRPPNHHGCRSILVPVTIYEEKPQVTGIDIDPTNESLITEYERRGKTPPDLSKIKKSRNL